MKTNFVSIALAIHLFSPSLLFASCDPNIARNKLDAIYKDYGDGTVLDTKTKLVWQKCSLGQIYSAGTCIGSATTYSWDQAMNAAVTANTAGMFGYTDWRLPNAKEIFSLSELACKDPAINSVVFPAVEGFYWTSTAYMPTDAAPELIERVYIQDSGTGLIGGEWKNDDIFHVRLVRNKIQE